MKLFIDTANIKEIEEAASWGVIAGVTTNPSLVAKEGRDFKQVVKEICALIDGPISAEVISLKSDEMIKEAREIAQWHKNIIIKLPMTDEGIRACKILSQEGIKTNVTLVFSANQALLAALAGATYVSPFIGRLDDAGQNGLGLIEEIVHIFSNYGFDTEIITASVRHPVHVLEAAKIGSHIATVPFKVLQQMFRHPLTDIGIQRFLADWKGITK